MTSIEGIRRASSHDWVEVDDQTEKCIHCDLVLAKSTNLENVPACTAVHVCPECNRKGSYEGRILINGRGYYQCAEGHRWQDKGEKRSNKGATIL